MQLHQIVEERTACSHDNTDARQRLFEYVQAIPYQAMGVCKLESPAEFVVDVVRNMRGDCRHKHLLLRELFIRTGETVELAKMMYDIRDLPLPQDSLEPFLGSCTTYTHLALILTTGGKRTLVDATWDPGLAKAGFPVNTGWNGLDDTLSVTREARLCEFGANNLKVQRDPRILADFNAMLNNYIARVRDSA
jgi:hypothetical protein